MIYLVRHGQTDWNVVHRTQGHMDIPLNDVGRKQAEILAEKMTCLKIDKIISSDLLRAFETAQIINRKRNAPLIRDIRLREVNYGDLEGVLGSMITQETWCLFDNAPHQLHAESMSSVFNRVGSLLSQLNMDEHILLVTHGGSMRMMMYYTENPQKFDQEKYAATYKFLKINNTDIFKLDLSKSKKFELITL